MLRAIFAEPRVRRAYVLTKVGVVAAAAVVTWPLSRAIGPKAWYAFFVFAGVIGALTVAVLATASSAPAKDEQDESSEEDDDPSDHPATVVLPLEDSIDLHSFPPKDIPDVVKDYLGDAHAHGLREVRLIHGRGIGVQRERVRSLLTRHPLVQSFHDAPPTRGGWGATVAYLVDEEPDS